VNAYRLAVSANKVRQLLVASADGCAGFHGTSVEAVIAAARTGFLPARADESAFFFYDARHPRARELACEYAAGNARLHLVQRFLAFDSIDDIYAAQERDDPEVVDALREAASANDARGVVVALAPAALKLPRWPAPEPGEIAVKVRKNGLPIRLAQAIEALGEHERLMLEREGLS
jgi:hypothetical protein